jgi:hypothetical protein
MGSDRSARKDMIAVRKKHITEAMPANSSKCMIAEAIKDGWPGAHHVNVDLATIRFTDGKGNRRTYLTPGKCQIALVEFDAGIEQEEFSFSLHRPVHISPGHGRTQKGIRVSERGANKETKATNVHVTKIGGKRPPVLRNVTRRRFGIRGLRVNEQGQVVKEVPAETTTTR